MGLKHPWILFCGKHRVNFAMFEPVYQLLRRVPGLGLGLSSGRYRRRPLIGWLRPKRVQYWNERLFGEFDVDPAHLVRTSGADPYPYDVFVTSNRDRKIHPRRARLAVQIFHGVSFRNFAVSAEYRAFDKLFFPGRYMMEQYLERGILEPGDPRMELIGMPKLDRLVNGAFRRDEVLSTFGLDPGRPTILWCPTGARHNSFELLGLAGVRALEATGFNLILKLHDHPHLPRGITLEALWTEIGPALGARSRLATRSDVTPLLAAADLLVTDASSVAYEYCLLDRPIIFVDVPKLLAQRDRMPGSAMDTRTHGRRMGRIIGEADELGPAVREELAEPGRLSAERQATAAHIFHDPGRATERMARRLLELAGHAAPSIPLANAA